MPDGSQRQPTTASVWPVGISSDAPVDTPAGARAAGELQVGDTVITEQGREARIRWIGIAPAGQSAIRIAAGALGHHLPRAPVTLAAAQTLRLDEDTVSTGLIAVADSFRTDSHATWLVALELDRPDCLLVEGLAVESYLDTGNRRLFASSSAPRTSAVSWSLAHPRLEGGSRLEALHRRVRMHAQRLAFLGEDRGSVYGYVDAGDARGLRGWAVDLENPTRRVLIEVVVNGIAVGQCRADQSRGDVARAGFGDGSCGFAYAFDSPLSPFERHVIEARDAETGFAIALQPLVLDAVERADATRVQEFADTLHAVLSAEGDADRALRLLELTARELRDRRDRGHRHAARGATQPVALVVDDSLPDPERDAGSQAILSHAASLRRLGHAVVFVPTRREDGPCSALGREGIAIAGPTARRSVEDALRAGHEAKLVYVHRIGNMLRYGPLIRARCPNARLVYNVADLHSLRLRRQAQLAGDDTLLAESRALEHSERYALEMADIVITHSHHEAVLLRSIVPAERVRVVGWTVAGEPISTAFRHRSGVAFVGGAAHAPNVDAASVILHELAPRLAALETGIKLHVIGEGLAERLGAQSSDSVELHGHVRELDGFLDNMRLTVAPLRFGSGVKGKVVRSFVSGLPCVMSPVAAEGMMLPEGLKLDCAKTIDAMVSRIVSLHFDEQANTASSVLGRAFAAEQFSDRAVDVALADVSAVAGEAVRRSTIPVDAAFM